MHGKFLFGGEAVTVPGTTVGFGFALFKLWLKPTGLPFKGYTAGSNQGLTGAALIETPVVEFTTLDLIDEEPFFELHGSTVDIGISPSAFLRDGGITSIKITKLTNDALPKPSIGFLSDACRGFSATAGDINFRTTLINLPAGENDPSGGMIINF